MTAVVQPRVPAGHSGGGRFAPKDWMFETGPLPFLDRPSTTELPPPPPPRVRRQANGAVLVSDNPDVPNRHRVHVHRDSAGRIVITYLEGATR